MNEAQTERQKHALACDESTRQSPQRLQGLGFGFLVHSMALLWFFAGFCAFVHGQNPPSEARDVDREIEQWIAKLGSESYTERTQAQRQIEGFGVRALNAVRQATRSPDAQIASQARFLLQSNQLEWAWNYDPFEVRKIVEDYKLASTSDKGKFIQKLNDLPSDHGLAALCRICCFETDEIHSKLAALQLLRRLEPTKIPGIDANPAFQASLDAGIVQSLIDSSAEESQTKDQRAMVLTASQGSSSRAASWVQLAYSQPDSLPLEAWTEILDQEQQLLQSTSPETKLSLVIELITHVAKQAKRQPEGRKLAMQIARRIPPLLVSNELEPDKLIEFAEWAMEAELPELVQEQYVQFTKQFPQIVLPILHYLLAESFAKQGDRRLADEIARKALARKPVVLAKDSSTLEPTAADAPNPAGKPDNPPAAGNPLQFQSFNSNFERANIAQVLIKRGMFDWAEAELREALAGQEDSPDRISMLSLHTLALMLHEQEQDGKAAEVLEKWMKRYESEKLFRMQVDDFQLDLPSNYYLYLANHHAKEGQTDKAREDYFKSIALASDNVDALIGLAKLQETPEEKRRRVAEQEQTISSLRNEIEAIDRDLRLANPMFQPMEQRRLANSLNTLAWLMANTDSDPREALMLSRRSCSLSPDQSAYQDTLAHCLEKNGRFKEAFRTQIKALKLEPHQLSLQRALVRFYQKSVDESAEKAAR